MTRRLIYTREYLSAAVPGVLAHPGATLLFFLFLSLQVIAATGTPLYNRHPTPLLSFSKTQCLTMVTVVDLMGEVMISTEGMPAFLPSFESRLFPAHFR